jgi:hypothetical protein
VRLATIAFVACGRVGFDPIAGAPVADTLPDVALPRPIAWWKLDEGAGTTATDSIAGITGTLGAITGAPPSWVVGHSGGALSFIGDSDVVTMPLASALDNLPELSVSVWLEPSSILSANGPHCPVDKGTPTAGWAVIALDAADGDIGFHAQHSTSATRRVSTGGVLAVGQWAHVITTWDGGNAASGVHVYVDGVEIAYAASSSDATDPRPDDSAIAVSINCGAITGFPGIIDELQIFDRALTAAQVAALP